MYTDKNYIFLSGNHFNPGEEYTKCPLSQFDGRFNVISANLPQFTTTYESVVDFIKTKDCKNSPIVVYKLNIINSEGEHYNVEVSADSFAFCRYSKFKSVDNIAQWYTNFALVDYKGFPCKVESVETRMYNGVLYGIYLKDANNVIINGICFKSDSEEKPEDELEE